LLHYENIQSPLHRDDVIRRLKLHLPGYDKGADNIFEITNQYLTIAIQRAEKLAERFSADSDPEPFTAIAELVKFMTTLRS